MSAGTGTAARPAVKSSVGLERLHPPAQLLGERAMDLLRAVAGLGRAGSPSRPAANDAERDGDRLVVAQHQRRQPEPGRIA